MALRHRTSLEGLEGETIHVEGPDPDEEPRAAAHFAEHPERWRGRFFIWYKSEIPRERIIFEMTETVTGTGEPLLRWNRVTDPTVLERIR